MTENPILMSDISNRDNARLSIETSDANKKEKGIGGDIYNNKLFYTMTRPVNKMSAEEFIVQSCINVESVNKNYMYCFKIFNELCIENDKKNGLYYSVTHKLANYLIENVLNKLTQDHLITIQSWLSVKDNHQIPDSFVNSFLSCIDKIKVCDRVLNNRDKINKRFNMDKVVSNSEDTNDIVEELCELIDTYNISTEAKYNIAIENVQYSLYKNGVQMKPATVLEHINNYFLNRNLVITDSEIKGFCKVLSGNMFITESDIEISGSDAIISKKFNLHYWGKITKLAESCSDKECKKIIYSLRKVNTERKVSEYINISVYNKLIDKTTPYQDRICLYSSIYYIPLITDVTKGFIKCEIMKLHEAITKQGSLTNREMDEFRDIDKKYDNDTLNNEAADLYLNTDNSDDPFSESYIDKRTAEEYVKESLSEDESIKKLINDFKAEQDKNPNKFKVLVTKLYSKPVENIIDETPRLFNLVRYGFIFSTATLPVIGPVFAAITGFVDHVISTQVTMSQAKKFYKYLKDEQSKVNKKLESSSNENTTKKLEEYNKNLDKCINNVYNYISDIDEEDEDINSDDDFDFEFEAAKLCDSMESLNELMNYDYDSLIDKMNYNIESIINSDGLFEFAKLISNSNDKVISEFITCLEEYNSSQEYDYKRTETINSIKNNIYSYSINTSNELDSIEIKYESTNIIDSVLTESKFDANTVKLALKDFSSKLKELNAKQKQAFASIDNAANNMINGISRALTNDRREAIIKGSIIPSFSKCIKSAIVIGGAALVHPVLAVITAFGMFAASKALNAREKQLLYDEIDVELQVVEKQISQAENDGDMNQYRFLLTYQRKLQRERQRIKYGIKAPVKNIPKPSNR